MRADLHDIVAGVRIRRWKIRDDGMVDRVTVVGRAKAGRYDRGLRCGRLSMIRGVRLQPDVVDGGRADLRERRTSRLEVVATPNQPPSNRMRVRTAEADDADTAAAGRRRYRDDGV